MRNRLGKHSPSARGPSRHTSHRLHLACPVGDRQARLAVMLAEAGFHLSLTTTGPDTAEVLSGRNRPAIVILDWLLGEPGAAALCRLLREDSSSNDYVYIIVMLPAGASGSLPEALAAGADGVLTSPISADEMLGQIDAGIRVLDVAERLRRSERETARTLAKLQAVQEGIEADLVRARKLQQTLMGPRKVRFGDYEVNMLLHPAGHVGGDLVGLLPINPGRIVLYAIDVCGSGVAAALMNARIAAHLSMKSGDNIALMIDERGIHGARPPVKVAETFNRLVLAETGVDMYFTMVYADLDLTTGSGRLVQAGHPHPVLQAADGGTQLLGDGGMPIGLFEDAAWDEVAFTLPPGGRLFFGSDGITEAASPDNVQLGHRGLVAILRTNAFLTGAPLLESLCYSVEQYTEGKRNDDISAIVIDHRPDPGGGRRG